MPVRVLLVCLTLSLLTACAVSRDAVESNAGTYSLSIEPPPDAWKLDQPLSLTVRVWSARADDLAVRAAMPAHGHGLLNPSEVKVRKIDDGRYEVRGLRLHMAGEWEVYFDLQQGAVTERAQVSVTLP